MFFNKIFNIKKSNKSISGAKIFIVFETRNTIINALKKLVKNGNDLLFYQPFKEERHFIHSQEKDIKVYLDSLKTKFEESPCRFPALRGILSQFNDVEGEKYLVIISGNHTIPAHNSCISLDVTNNIRQHIYFCTRNYPFHMLVACSKCNALFSYYKYTDRSCENVIKNILNSLLVNKNNTEIPFQDCSKCEIRIHLFPKMSPSNSQKTSPVFSVKDLESLELYKDDEETTKRVFLIPPM